VAGQLQRRCGQQAAAAARRAGSKGIPAGARREAGGGKGAGSTCGGASGAGAELPAGGSGDAGKRATAATTRAGGKDIAARGGLSATSGKDHGSTRSGAARRQVLRSGNARPQTCTATGPIPSCMHRTPVRHAHLQTAKHIRAVLLDTREMSVLIKQVRGSFQPIAQEMKLVCLLVPNMTPLGRVALPLRAASAGARGINHARLVLLIRLLGLDLPIERAAHGDSCPKRRHSSSPPTHDRLQVPASAMATCRAGAPRRWRA
jgi:hypothetical protein